MKYIKGNLFEAKTDALVNAVNTVGVMGKGIALQFKQTFPHNYKVYRAACKNGELVPGRLLAVNDFGLGIDKLIINFPTKKDWKQKSEYEYVASGLTELAKLIETESIKSIAIPALGCGNGGLDWEKVKLMIEKHLGHLKAVEIIVFEPN